MILLIDNYDSFVHNLARYFERLGHKTEVIRNDAISSEEAIKLAPDAIVISPGPCSPSEAGVSIDLVQESLGRIPLLGICLGHQAIAAALGGTVIASQKPWHGRSSLVHHDEQLEFAGLPNPLSAGRYHSLIVEEASLPPELIVSARTADGTIMALRHRSLPTFGWQFHPESVLTEHGEQLISGFLNLLNPATSSSDDAAKQASNKEKHLTITQSGDAQLQGPPAVGPALWSRKQP